MEARGPAPAGGGEAPGLLRRPAARLLAAGAVFERGEREQRIEPARGRAHRRSRFRQASCGRCPPCRPAAGIRDSPRRSDAPAGQRARAYVMAGWGAICEDFARARRARGLSRGGTMTTMWSKRHAIVRRICSSTGWIGEALRRRIGEGDAMECSPPPLTAALEGVVTIVRRAAEPPSRRAAEPPSRRAAEPHLHACDSDERSRMAALARPSLISA